MWRRTLSIFPLVALVMLPAAAMAAPLLPSSSSTLLLAISLPATLAAAMMFAAYREAKVQRSDVAALEANLEAERRRTEELDRLVEQLEEGVLIVDAETHAVLFRSDRCKALIGDEPIIPEAIQKLLMPRPLRRAADRARPPGAPFTVVIGQTVLDVTTRAMPPLAGRTRTALLLSDVTERHRDELRLRHLASHDRLTGLLDRETVRRNLAARLEVRDSKGPIALLVVDIDDFRALNMRLGDSIGDRLLTAFATRLKRSVRDTDIVARLEGDMFAIIQDNAGTGAEVQALARRLMDVLTRPYNVHSGESDEAMTITIGAALAPVTDTDLTADRMLAAAEVGLMRAKRSGRGQLAVEGTAV